MIFSFILLVMIFASISMSFKICSSFRNQRSLVYPSSSITASCMVNIETVESTTNLIRSRDISGLSPVTKSIVLVVGFEAFNFQLYKKTVDIVKQNVPSVHIEILTDIDIAEKSERVESILQNANVLLCSLLFDYEQLQWMLPRIQNIPTKFCFESAQELMSQTMVGSFNMAPVVDTTITMNADGTESSSQSVPVAPGPPPFVKNLLKQFGSNKEEDKMAGYLNLLKIGPKVLNLIPTNAIQGPFGEKLRDIKTWLTVYAYWNQGTVQNIVSMLYFIIETFQLAAATDLPSPLSSDVTSSSSAYPGNISQSFKMVTTPIVVPKAAKLIETPNVAFYHPDLYLSQGYVEKALTYTTWYEKTHKWVNDDTPRVGLLLYRKHVLSDQAYIGNMIALLEDQGLMPVPVFISGVEAHIIVRDIFVTREEVPNLAYLGDTNCIVDCIVNTIGFPLVGGPAGSMEGGRRTDVSREILMNKNIPYFVAAPLLIQDMNSWLNTGVQGLQTVILYSLPELDGAIDTVVLGGLVNKDQIVLLPERVRKLTRRLKAWIRLRKLQASERKLSLLVYGFPPNVGAVGTAALLNVARSLNNVLLKLDQEGYDIGNNSFIDNLKSINSPSKSNSEEVMVNSNNSSANSTYIRTPADGLIKILSLMSQNSYSPAAFQATCLELGLPLSCIVNQEVSWQELQSWLGKQMSSKVVKQWGDLERYVGLGSAGTGKFAIQGIQLGNVFLGVQPLVGTEGDPMRLLFERDLTPHPQYTAFYLWLQRVYNPDVLVHFGMHGTVEWLPGNALGNTPESWPDMLIGDMPNLYIYAANNPSESILAKRRGYATIISHNVPPYSRAGLYNELKQLKELATEFKAIVVQQQSIGSDNSSCANSPSDNDALDGLSVIMIAVLEKCGMFNDLPFNDASCAQLDIFNTDTTAVGGDSSSSTETYPLCAEKVEALLKSLSSSSYVNKKEIFFKAFSSYVTDRLNDYLLELERKLFSEGLYEIGSHATSKQIEGYLSALVNETKILPPSPSLISSVKMDDERSQSNGSGIDSLRTIAHGVMSDKPTSTILLQLKDPLLTESKFSASLLTRKKHNILDNVGTYFEFQKQRVFRHFGSLEADDHLNQLVMFSSDLYDIHNVADVSPESSSSSDQQQQQQLHHSIKQQHLQEVTKAVTLSQALYRNPELELNGLMNGLSGGFISAAPGGDIIRDGINVLPTGRNIYSLDPYRVPSDVAMIRGRQAVELILKQHQAANHGEYPETVAVTLWGLDAIKTKGESVAIVLALVGAEPVKEATGRIINFALIPLAQLSRPRIDVLASLSGIFRDSFENVLDLLDKLFEAAATAREPNDMNYIKKHSEAMKSQGLDRTFSRLFSNAPGDFGSMVNEKIGSGDWEKESELGDVWEKRNAFSYGGKGEKGSARVDVLKALLNTTDRVVQEIDSVEYGLTDIQEYYANTGAIKKAAENNRDLTSYSTDINSTDIPSSNASDPSSSQLSSSPKQQQRKQRKSRVDISVIEAQEAVIKPKNIEEVLRTEYRTKLLNPKWSDAMLKQGSAGAYEISGRLTAMVGWSATTDFQEKWVFDATAEKYALDENMAQKLKDLNPEAFRNILKRLLEASGRGYWAASDDVLMKLQELYEEAEDEIEGV